MDHALGGKSLGRVRKVPPAVRPAGSAHRTPLGPPSGRTTRLCGQDRGGERRATLRGRTASLTTTTGRTASGRTHGGRTGEGAR
ncbi:DUF6380 family protein [Streptomyces sp. NPDC046859]|uniref:DUF6380 family protein n=1 Tax=Streptomyces sp. NPDC046859 TaxID=3155734 RepID=UPI0033EC09EE